MSNMRTAMGLSIKRVKVKKGCWTNFAWYAPCALLLRNIEGTVWMRTRPIRELWWVSQLALFCVFIHKMLAILPVNMSMHIEANQQLEVSKWRDDKEAKAESAAIRCYASNAFEAKSFLKNFMCTWKKVDVGGALCGMRYVFYFIGIWWWQFECVFCSL